MGYSESTGTVWTYLRSLKLIRPKVKDSESTGRIENLVFVSLLLGCPFLGPKCNFSALFDRVTSLFSGILSVYIELTAFIVNHNESVAVTTKK